MSRFRLALRAWRYGALLIFAGAVGGWAIGSGGVWRSMIGALLIVASVVALLVERTWNVEFE